MYLDSQGREIEDLEMDNMREDELQRRQEFRAAKKYEEPDGYGIAFKNIQLNEGGTHTADVSFFGPGGIEGSEYISLLNMEALAYWLFSIVKQEEGK